MKTSLRSLILLMEKRPLNVEELDFLDATWKNIWEIFII